MFLILELTIRNIKKSKWEREDDQLTLFKCLQILYTIKKEPIKDCVYTKL